MMTGIPSAAPLWTFDKIPKELQALTQWMVWRFEQNDKGKLSKVPYNAATNYKASVTNAEDWHSFATAVEAYNNGRENGTFGGVGLVFNAAMSAYAGIDIDDAKGDEKLLLAHRRVIAAFKPFGYCEISPSGKGVHIILKGRIEGTRKFGVEAYSTGRFFTFTGWALCSNPIAECQELLNELQAELRPNRTTQTLLSSEPQTADDDTIIRNLFAAKNGVKAASLFNGITTIDDASANDLALCNIIVWHTKNFEQVERIWLRSALGQREKVRRRPAYRMATIRKSFDRHAADQAALTRHDFSAVVARAKAAAAERASREGQAHHA